MTEISCYDDRSTEDLRLILLSRNNLTFTDLLAVCTVLCDRVAKLEQGVNDEG